MNKIITFHEHTNKLEVKEADILSKLWRVQNLYPIRTKTGHLIPFRLNKFQVLLAEHLIYKTYDPKVILKARQLGITTFFCIWFLDDILFSAGINAAIQSHKQESLKDIFNIVLCAYENGNDLIKHDVDTSNKNEIVIPELRSKIEIKLEVRSMSVNRILYSEFAHTVKYNSDRITATEGSLAPNCVKAYESTPLGLNEFHTLYTKNKKHGNSFFFPWWKNPEYQLPVIKSFQLADLTPKEIDMKNNYNLIDKQIQFRRSKLDTMTGGDLQFDQEFPSNDVDCFLLSGRSPLDRRLIIKLRDEALKKPPKKVIKEGNGIIKIFRVPTLVELSKRPLNFFFGADPAEGIGGNYSGFVLIGVDQLGNAETLLTMHGYYEPVTFARLIKKYMEKYYKYEIDGDIYLPQGVVERNNHGHAVLGQFVTSCPYHYLYVHRDNRVGFLSTAVTRKIIFDNVFNAINQKTIDLRDPVILEELSTFILTKSLKLESDKGKYDDMVIATALAYHGYFNSIGMGLDDAIQKVVD